MDLEEAQAIVAAHRQMEQEKAKAERRLLIGRYFKYHNSYGDDERWWLYATVTGVSEWGHLYGWSFEHTVTGKFSIQTHELLHIVSEGWREIDSAEFWGEASKMSTMILAQLLPNVEGASTL